MLKMVMDSDGEEQVMSLEDSPEIVLIDTCNLVLRHRDLRNPDNRNFLREILNALKVKAESKSTEPNTVSREELKQNIAETEDLLKQFDEENSQ
ncbi:MAG: hypothetical protein LBS21_03940 [Clostridiales bacterium]|nr:hypothetical protein [Clostridiales bacterium]